MDLRPQEQLIEFEKQLKNFASSKRTAKDYLDLFTLYEKVRRNNVSVSNVLAIIEKVTNTKVPA